MTVRHALSWKPYFYDALLPALRTLGPALGDQALGAIGRAFATGWPPRGLELRQALARVREAVGADWDVDAVLPRLQGNVLRFLARDRPLDGGDDASFFARFDVTGAENLDVARERGRGVILVGSHLGGHLSAAHWVYRRNLPLRMLIQRPQHVSALLDERFDRTDEPHPQSGFFLRRFLTPEEASKRIFRTRSALRDGLIVYLKGDVPWVGANTRPARFLGHDRTFQSLWAEFASLFRAPVVPVFCTHLPGGRYRLAIDPPFDVKRGGEGEAVVRYLARLEAEVVAHPADAVGHLLWPCYGPPSVEEAALRKKARARSRKRKAAAGTR